MNDLDRIEPRSEPILIPRRFEAEPGLVEVDATWGTIQPIELAAGVQTVGEIDVLVHLEDDLPVVDSRTADFYDDGTIPGAVSIPFTDVRERRMELSNDYPTIFFCNGPQCGQSPTAIRTLLEAGHPAARVHYYRGGLHDWITLGLPTVSELRFATELRSETDRSE